MNGTSEHHINTLSGIEKCEMRIKKSAECGLIDPMTTLLAQRLKTARKHAHLTQAAAAERCGWGDGNQSRIGNYESGYREPRIDEVLRMAKAYRVSCGWLTTGIGRMDDAEDVHMRLATGSEGQYRPAKEIPIIEWSAVTDWNGEMPKGAKMRLTEQGDYALVMYGNSMTNPAGHSTVPDGAVLTVDRHETPAHGSIVIAQPDAKYDPICARLEIVGGRRMLTYINPHYPPTPIDDHCPMFGVVKNAFIDLFNQQ